MTITHDIVQKLWNLCNHLKHDGVTYHQYVTELTYLLFLKMMREVEKEDQLPEGYRWGDLTSKNGVELLDFYRLMLIHLGSHGSSRVQEIYAGAGTIIKKPKTLTDLVTELDKLDWYSARQEGLGDLYEGLLEKNAGETKSGAGQYFTPRPLINCMVQLMKPQAGEVIQDPAAGTGGFLIAADNYIKEKTDQLFTLSEAEGNFQRKQAFCGLEHVQDTHRLSLMNMMLHGIESGVAYGDTLSPDGANLPKSDVMLTNPPFGSSGAGGLPTRDDFTFETANKQLCFLQHIYRGLKAGGRAAVVLPDNVLFEDNKGKEIRQDLMDKCKLHTILRLPTGIFYAQGVKTNVLFFTRGKTDKGNTENIWVYDMRTNMPKFGKRTPLTEAHFTQFVKVFGEDVHGTSPRKEADDTEERWKCFSREDIEKRGDNLDISWLKDESASSVEDLDEPDVIAARIMNHLRTALGEMEALSEMLDEDQNKVEAAE
ncbi:N-6 DNA methylase [Sneathiella sp. P13V-1]|uniref:class I SAM-dependent DNA methyltransferase n=1 Tax=Sneathiella sp. P13V-1 TaxID=2697366 RepID=UPI00187B847E|nr:N-6 DNA methylase [Sneathiella sp. P13V-1]MBE7635243.1 N-6 DNA methylase [Sneathiella sp. P13V-1]